MRLPKILALFVALVLAAGGARALIGSVTGAGAREAVGVAADQTSVRPGGARHAPRVARPTTTSALVGQGLQLPAGMSLPSGAGSPAPTAAKQSVGSIPVLPVPNASALPAVKAIHTVEVPDAVVMLPGSLTRSESAALHRVKGLAAIEEVDTGTVGLAGAPVVTFGVDPATFRAFTPAASAVSNRLWQYVAGGSLVSSYEMATDRRLHLGSNASIVPAGAPHQSVQGWLGAFASIGLPGVDLVVSHAYSADLGLTPNSGLVVSAPLIDAHTLQASLQAAVPGAAVELLHPDQIPLAGSGNTLSSVMRQRLITAALSRVGRPYVWGAVGPESFDCSGLVQWSYRQAGVLMPRTADEQFLTGVHLPLSDAAPGDLLFWTYDPNDPGFVDHTAIYLGNGLMVVAPHTGLDVQVVPVPTNEFAGVVRVVLQSS